MDEYLCVCVPVDLIQSRLCTQFRCHSDAKFSAFCSPFPASLGPLPKELMKMSKKNILNETDAPWSVECIHRNYRELAKLLQHKSSGFLICSRNGFASSLRHTHKARRSEPAFGRNPHGFSAELGELVGGRRLKTGLGLGEGTSTD